MLEQPHTPTARTRNRRGEGARLRDEIVAGAAALLDETGDESSVTLRAIARRVGITAPSIYRHFADQPAIMLAVVQQAFSELAAELHRARDDAGDDPRARLFAGCTAYPDFARSRPARDRTVFGGVWRPGLGSRSVSEAELYARCRETLQLSTEALRGCVAGGVATCTDPAAE